MKTSLKLGALVAVSAALVLAGAVSASAARSDRTRAGVGQQTVFSGTLGTFCGGAWQTKTTKLFPPDDTPDDNPSAGALLVLKKCQGPVLATLSGETNTPNAGEFIHIDMKATCQSPAGLPNGCVKGTIVHGLPGYTYFQNNYPQTGEDHSITMVWPGLAAGKWIFEAKAGGNGTAYLWYRTFVVEMYSSN